MAYRIKVRKEYSYPIALDVVGDGGTVSTYTFNGVFQRFDQAAIDEIRKAQLTDEALARKVLIGWEGVQDAEGIDMLFNEENLTLLLKDNGVCWSVAKAWFESLEKELRKN